MIRVLHDEQIAKVEKSECNVGVVSFRFWNRGNNLTRIGTRG